MQWKKARQLKFISDAPVIRVATVDGRGKPQVTPVCHIVWKEKIYWASDFGAAKLKNIEKHHAVALVADEYNASWKSMGGVMVQGKARVIRHGPLFTEVRDRLYKKFPVYKSNAPFEEGEAVIIEVTPSHRYNWWFK